ncbi:MAG: hypothetical protein P8K68_11230 [Algibacter sp.]|uniref:DUF7486 family protein n=1 Tax=Algibacter sp. TaxID=1872428 RepID=UPI002635244B|nr:hypothetical protein [Algibacter sp.]MDG1730836.1 hypothetical protein [Algibacter sp.]MDG2179338.1 hypothetical protein [Algibacter sp.]
MKNSNQSFIRAIYYNVFILGFLFVFTACNNNPSKDKTSKTESDDIVKVEEIFWNVKAIHPNGKSLDVKVFDNAGKSFDVKAIQNSDQDNLLDVKAFIDGEKLPVKILVSKSQFAPVVAITNKGNAYKIKAITPEGEQIEVIGVIRFGNVVIMKALTKKGKFYGVKAISPTGQLNDVKGIKINPQEREMTSRGLNIYAHVKAMHPSDNEDDFRMPKRNITKDIYQSNFKRIIWNIKAVTKDGKNLDVKAFDAEGNTFDVKATQDSRQHSFMNIKAFVDGAELPVKIMQSTDEYAPVKAIGSDGTIYDVKALTDDNVKLDVKGISRSGNIIHVKAINENGEFLGVKAFAPDGKLNVVKGMKIFEREIEMKIQGNPVYAHLKAITQ